VRDLGVLRRRAVALAVVGLALVVAALSRHVLGLQLPRIHEPPLILCGLTLAGWALFALGWRTTRARTLAHEAASLRAHALGFGARVEAWLVAANASDELEAEALRRAVLDRHTALVAALRAHLAGRDPSEDHVVQAMTRPAERHGRHQAALLLHLATLQREALAEAQRRGFLGEARLLALDDALHALSTAHPLEPRRTALPERALALLMPTYASLMLLLSSQRLTLVLAAALAALTLVALEAFASEPIADPRVEVLTTL